ncbi:hypothetical protein AC249_AIPGENE6782 [Exaiptasia diaphana]|nr:hypothetical protein AC249_AIPGENE6782 [Exaiptasia diaphana]
MTEETRWNTFKKNMQEKRTKKKINKDKGKDEQDTLTVQRLSAEVSGKAQKYSRIGAREFVPFKGYEELTIENIKEPGCSKPEYHY